MLSLCIKNYLRFWVHHKAVLVATLSVLTFTFLLQTLFICLTQNLIEVVERWGSTGRVVLYLQDGLSPVQLESLKEQLGGLSYHSLKYISKEETTASFREQMKDYLPEVTNDPQFRNPFPASLELGLPDQIFNSLNKSEIDQKIKELSNLAGVGSVSYGGDWLPRYSKFVDFVRGSGGAVTFLLLIMGLFVVANSIQAAINYRREEIEILELVGASKIMIRIPFILEGALSGFLAATLALLIAFILYSIVSGLALDALSFWTLGARFTFLRPVHVFSILLTGIAVGAGGSFFSVRRINDGWAASHGVE